MIPESYGITLLFLFCPVFYFSFISALGGGEGQVTQRIFLLLESFPITSWRFALKYNLYAFCIFKACFLNLSRVIVFKEPAQPVTFLKKINLHFEVPFECHSLDLSSILFNCYVQAPHKSMMLDAGWHRTQDFGKKLVGLHWGREGNKICVFVCLI